MYICQGRIDQSVLKHVPDNIDFLRVYDEASVKQVYETCFTGETVSSVRFFPNTHESVIVEINDDYIVKFPRPNRELAGLKAEQAVTNLLRGKVEVAVPALSLHVSPVALARYRKLPGTTFDKAKFAALSP